MFAIVELSTGKILFRYESAAADYGKFGGMLADRSVVVHIEIPAGQSQYTMYSFEKQVFYPGGGASAEDASILLLKQKRNMLLAETDYLFLTDVDVSVIPNKLKEEYKKYRSQLRAMFKDKPKAASVVFPVKPANP